MQPRLPLLLGTLLGLLLTLPLCAETPDDWRKERRLVDTHIHLGPGRGPLDRAIGIMDRAGIGIGVNLSGGTVTATNDKPAEFKRNKELADSLYPGRFVHLMNLDYRGWDDPDFARKAAQQIEEGHRLGAAGLKEYKRLGLFQRNAAGELIKIDDPKLDSVWAKCGALGMPVAIHVADPCLLAPLRRIKRALGGIKGSSELVVRRRDEIPETRGTARRPGPGDRPASPDKVHLPALRE